MQPKWYVTWLFGLVMAIVGFSVGYSGCSGELRMPVEKCEQWVKEVREEHKNECLCGAEQSCSFGPGIVGKQKCRTGGLMKNEWSRCEPDPKYKVQLE